MRLFALPLSRRAALQTKGSASQLPLFYLHAQRLDEAQAQRLERELSKPQQWLNKATGWGATQWAKLGRNENEKSWQRRTHRYGERLMDRIDFEEWALKSIDPTLRPKPLDRLRGASSKLSDGEVSEKTPLTGNSGVKVDPSQRVELVYPPSLLDPEPLFSSLQKLLAHREPHHRSGMWKCILILPLTLPVALLPIVPNLPAFYLMWRAWSHWRAWKASEYLGVILRQRQIEPVPSRELERIYETSKPELVQLNDAEKHTAELLLTPEMIPRVAKSFRFTRDEQAELERAVAQAKTRLVHELEARAAADSGASKQSK